jgi:hypothetical protein
VHKIFDLALIWQLNIYVSHLYSTVLQTVFLMYLVVSSSKYFRFKRILILGAVNVVSPANAFRKDKWNIFRKYILNSELGSFSAWPLIPKAQDAMTSVVYLYIVSATSTGEPVNSTWWNSYYIFSYYIHMHSANVICFLVVSNNVWCLSANLYLMRLKYMFSLLIVPNLKFVSVFNRKIG